LSGLVGRLVVISAHTALIGALLLVVVGVQEVALVVVGARPVGADPGARRDRCSRR
jgi:hypothetical protein